jgi:hypothetical protein
MAENSHKIDSQIGYYLSSQGQVDAIDWLRIRIKNEFSHTVLVWIQLLVIGVMSQERDMMFGQTYERLSGVRAQYLARTLFSFPGERSAQRNVVGIPGDVSDD